ncbi:AMP-binding protein [Salibacterium halotolerans]|uniref:Fatty-acyl-CoA synthase n=1 Tax=Salibacterium halotolerans TaxID=1884432 RepID=A0A1I5UHI1_9BACI|nr:AMP-binding protein [Salibacterium halotolerans]SFP94507.1 fatty-acyl-CoA synthase [Salibacterium halotolerans]
MFVPLLLTDFLDRAVLLYGNRTAVIDGSREVTYAELNHNVNQLSRALNDLGIKKGDKAAYLTRNCLELVEGYYGVFQTGAVMTPLGTSLSAEEYVFILNHSESRVLIVEEALYSRISSITDRLETVEHIIVIGESPAPDKCIHYHSWRDQFPGHPYDRVELEEEDIATLQYTRGTTGQPKGVLTTHRSNYLHALSAMHHLRVSDRDRLLHVLPMHHANGWGAPFIYTANGAVQVMQQDMEAPVTAQHIDAYHITVVHMTPPVLQTLLDYYKTQSISPVNRDVRLVVSGEIPPQDFVHQVETELDWEFVQVYGMTETSPLVAVSKVRPQHQHLTGGQKEKVKAKTGFPMIGANVKVVDEEGEEIPRDGTAVGEIIIRSNHVMESYLKNPEETSQSIKNGWLHTGDRAVIDPDGYIEIKERKRKTAYSSSYMDTMP